MIEINVRAWADWDKCIDYIKEMQQAGFKIKIVNVPALFEIWHDEDLNQLGFTKKEAI